MTTATLRLEAAGLVGLDTQLCALGALRLLRSDEGLFIECGSDLVARARCLLARAGVRAEAAEAPRRTAGLVPGIATDLEPMRMAHLFDAISVRPLSEGEATARCVRRRVWRDQVDEAAIRVVLRGGPAFAWWRVVWAPRYAVRSPVLRSVRTIVFDRSALAGSTERLALATEACLTRWAE